MGKVMSVAARKANRFNVENRAHRVLEREKPIPAPKYESNLRDMERTLQSKYLLYIHINCVVDKFKTVFYPQWIPILWTI